MTKPTLTQATGVTVEEVSKLGRLSNSKELRGVQTKLTATATELRNLANGSQRGGGLIGNLGALLTFEQCQLLRDAADLVESIGQSVTHAKEKRVRSEKDAKQRQDARLARAKILVAQTFPLPVETNEQRLDVFKAALILNRAEQYQGFDIPVKFNMRIRGYLKEPAFLRDRTLSEFHISTVASLRYGLIDEITGHLAYDDGSTVEDRLQLLQGRVAETVAQAALTADERETLRLWKEALCPDAIRQECQA